MTAAKICGLTRNADANVAMDVGAAYIGVILASGPRLLDVDQARTVLGARRAGVKRVAVFGTQSAAEVIAIVRELDLDVAQLHGTSTAADVVAIGAATSRAVWPVLRVSSTVLPDSAAELAAAAGWVVLDAQVAGQLGGTGVALDWSGLAGAVNALRQRVPGVQIVLAGGLNARNVSEAIRLLAPEVVDVSSGVETAPGVKDPEAVGQFVTAAHAATGIRG
jgi:phosphoribosylanthranilate isomerase